ncbi:MULTISPECIES: class I SAM-dependent methyltransferase [Mycolicibacterium]|uniref:class I SAM-dependent methyltransferase n=1 Tax=Mycolicibacterium TaxID=1866885 RepID=UPI001C3D7D15|nr:class I SAM-dependent methyltransferase [Mycolicibacterium sp. PAM1]MBV5244628.1 class I SAM-dependent methyltransferase [Mycolicibacterium sp. PAM1]
MDGSERPVNHHGDHPGFSGLTGQLCAVAFLLTGRETGRLAADLTAVSATDHVLDIGCGPGNACRIAAARGARVTGVDPSAAMLRVARIVTRGASVTWVKGGAEALPVPDAAATVAWALATVHHWPDVDAGLAEIHRALGPGARFLAVERQAEPFATGISSHGWTGAQAETFAAMCESAGLTAVRVGSGRAGKRRVWTVHATRP